MNNQDLFSIHCLEKSLVEKIITEKIQNLTEEDLEDCKQWKFDHIIPLNLDASTHLEKELEQIQLGDDDASDNE